MKISKKNENIKKKLVSGTQILLFIPPVHYLSEQLMQKIQGKHCI